jgi:uncharacterized membrane protein
MQDEQKELILLLTITLGIAIFGFMFYSFGQTLFAPDLLVRSYDASFSWNGTLEESYTYQVGASDQYRSLNRKYESPVFQNEQNGAYVRFLSIKPPSGTIGYVKDANGAVIITSDDERVQALIAERAGKNEAGAINPDYYRSGTYSVSYVWDIVPPIERGYDGIISTSILQRTIFPMSLSESRSQQRVSLLCIPILLILS